MKLKTKLSKLRHDGRITNAEYSIIINALNRKPKERVIAEIKFDEDTLRKLVKDKVDELTTKFATRPCEDAISRAEALRIAKSYYHAEYVVDKIRQLPSVTPWSDWIPVSEKLPEPLTAVLLTVRYKSSGCLTYQMGYWEDTLEKWEKWIEIGTLDDEFEILAWMELPEKYEEGEDE